MTTINMRLFRTVLVFVVAVVIVQGQPLSNSGVQSDKVSPISLPESTAKATEAKLADKEKDPSMKEPAEMEPLPELSSPAMKPEIPSPDSKPELAPPELPENFSDRRHVDYDQRQNGSENYRLNIDGLVLVFAPVEALLLAGGLGSEMNGQANLTSALNQLNPKNIDEQLRNIPSHPELEKPRQPVHSPSFYKSSKPAEGPVSIKLINLIAPLLEQRRH